MDFAFNPNDVTVPQVALYSTMSFLVVTVVGVFLYITCSKKYKLNWFEKNLLETACESQDLNARYVYWLHLTVYLWNDIISATGHSSFVSVRMPVGLYANKGVFTHRLKSNRLKDLS